MARNKLQLLIYVKVIPRTVNANDQMFDDYSQFNVTQTEIIHWSDPLLA